MLERQAVDGDSSHMSVITCRPLHITDCHMVVDIMGTMWWCYIQRLGAALF